MIVEQLFFGSLLPQPQLFISPPSKFTNSRPAWAATGGGRSAPSTTGFDHGAEIGMFAARSSGAACAVCTAYGAARRISSGRKGRTVSRGSIVGNLSRRLTIQRELAR